MAYSGEGLGSRPGTGPHFPPIHPPSRRGPEQALPWIPIFVFLGFLLILIIISLEAFLYTRWPYSLLSSRWSLRLPRFRSSPLLKGGSKLKSLYRTQHHVLDNDAQEYSCVPDRLCNACDSAIRKSGLIFGSFWTVIPKVERKDMYHSIEDLHQSSMALCHLCGILWHAISMRTKRRIQSEDEALIAHAQDSAKECMRIRLMIFEEMLSSRSLFDWADANPLYMQVYRGAEPISSKLEVKIVELKHDEAPIRREAGLNAWYNTTDTDHHICLAKSWIRLCTSNHEICQFDRKPETPFPTRLVYVGGQNFSDNIHLVLTSPKDYENPYVALSHCWGGANIFTLNSRTKSSMLESIPWNALTKNFQDAITITRRLGFSYIWIDSLCIIQDSTEDWARESAIMGSIYRYAYVTIASTGSADSSSGCFHTRNPLSLHPCTIATSQAQQVVVTPISEPEMFDEIEQSPLNQRAWVFQERLLSPRILHFGQNLLFWECNTKTASEINIAGTTYRQMRNQVPRIQQQRGMRREREPERACITYGKVDEQTWLLQESTGMHTAQNTYRSSTEDNWTQHAFSKQDMRLKGWPGYRGAFGTLINYTTPTVVSDELPNSGSLVGFHQRWFELVRLYSNGKLTRSSDKLIAVAGVARAVQQARGLSYLGGLWKEYLLLNLLWYVEHPENSRPKVYRAPSWSWASIDGQITHKVDPSQQHVDRSILEGQALIEEAQVTCDGSITNDPMGLIDGGFIHVKGAVCSVSTVEKFSKWLVLLDENRNFIAWFMPDIVMHEPYPRLYCLKLVTFRTKERDQPWGLRPLAPHFDSQGLVLEMREDETYRRVGFFSTDVTGFQVRLIFNPFVICSIKSIVVL